MPQSDGSGGALKRMTIRDPNNKAQFNFAINPQEYTIQRPQRVTVVKTMTDIVIEDFNNDIPVLKITGHTGWARGKGKERFDALEKLLYEYTTRRQNFGVLKTEPLYFYNYTDDKYYRVHMSPDGYSFRRSAENPLLFNYEMTFYIVSDTASYQSPTISVRTTKEITTSDANSAQNANSGTSGDGVANNGKSTVTTSTSVASAKKSTVVTGATTDSTGKVVPVTVTLGDTTGAGAVSAKNGYNDSYLLSKNTNGSGRLEYNVIGSQELKTIPKKTKTTKKN